MVQILASGAQNALYIVGREWFLDFFQHLEHQLPRSGGLIPLSLQSSNRVLDHDAIILGQKAKCNTVAISY